MFFRGKKGGFFLALWIWGGATPCGARVFDFSKESFAPYFHLRAGLVDMGNGFLQDSKTSSFQGSSIKHIYGGDLGFHLRSSLFSLSLGALIQRPQRVRGVEAFDEENQLLFEGDSRVLGYGPLVVVEWSMIRTPKHIWKLGCGFSYQWVDVTRSYELSAWGERSFGENFSKEQNYRGHLSSLQVTLGTEFHFSGSTTMEIQLGYQTLLNARWTHRESGWDSSGNSYAEGDPVEEDPPKKIDWAYPFVQLGFRTYMGKVR